MVDIKTHRAVKSPTYIENQGISIASFRPSVQGLLGGSIKVSHVMFISRAR
jgi:hypothetical protein